MKAVALAILFLLTSALARGSDPAAPMVIVHTYEWHEFTVTKDAPTSDDGRYKLKRVRITGSVELIRDDTDAVIVRPKNRIFSPVKAIEPIYVIEASASRQTARIRELRITCREMPNKAPEPTTTSVMPAAEQPSRRP